MPTYEYECTACGAKFDRRQAITEEPLTECPSCSGKVRRLVGGGSGFILKPTESGRSARRGHDCSLDRTGVTCCGRDERCGDSHCRDGK